jgi:UDP:flavonoid glycosyltransferase YjiC (YdhE family)
LTLERLRDAVRIVLGDPAYRARAGRLQASIEAADGLNRAADLIEKAFAKRPSPRCDADQNLGWHAQGRTTPLW